MSTADHWETLTSWFYQHSKRNHKNEPTKWRLHLCSQQLDASARSTASIHLIKPKSLFILSWKIDIRKFPIAVLCHEHWMERIVNLNILALKSQMKRVLFGWKNCISLQDDDESRICGYFHFSDCYDFFWWEFEYWNSWFRINVRQFSIPFLLLTIWFHHKFE